MERTMSRLWWVLPAVSVLLGALLGLVNLNSPDAKGVLRVPALLAGLILVAQGLLDLENGRRARAAKLPPPESHLPALNPPAPPVVLNRDDIVVLENRQQAGGGGVAVEQAQDQALAASTAVRESRGAVVAVLVLAIWLGLATLAYSNSPASLLRLSLLASFLLFASAWSMLQKRTD